MPSTGIRDIESNMLMNFCALIQEHPASAVNGARLWRKRDVRMKSVVALTENTILTCPMNARPRDFDWPEAVAGHFR